MVGTLGAVWGRKNSCFLFRGCLTPEMRRDGAIVLVLALTKGAHVIPGCGFFISGFTVPAFVALLHSRQGVTEGTQ